MAQKAPIELKEFVEERLRLLHRSPTDAARVGGLQEDFVLDILRGKKRSVHAANLAKLAQGLDMTPAELAVAQLRASLPAANGHAVASAPGYATDLPVFGTAPGPGIAKLPGFFLDRSRPVDHVRRPPGLSKTTGAYAIYVPDAALEPKHSTGDLIVVHPRRPVRGGDSAIVYVRSREAEAPQGFLKLVDIHASGGDVVVHQLKPPARHTFRAGEIVEVHRVLTVADLLEG